MPNEQNLVPYQIRTASEAREKGTAGGIASGVSRRRKKSLREAADLYLSLPPSDKRKLNRLIRRGLEPDEIDNQMMVISGLTEQAALGDARAAKVLFDLLGDAPAENAGGGVQIIDDL